MEETIYVYKISIRKPDRKDFSEDRGVDRKKILKPIFDKQCGKLWIGFIWLRTGTSGGLL
jgi:hypothetical protein